uniref:Uncharacterized protein n=1 Tax=Onchocerca volvulus TaxID=6282 RepID=A0A8R1XP47_ONCVO
MCFSHQQSNLAITYVLDQPRVSVTKASFKTVRLIPQHLHHTSNPTPADLRWRGWVGLAKGSWFSANIDKDIVQHKQSQRTTSQNASGPHQKKLLLSSSPASSLLVHISHNPATPLIIFSR